MKTRSITEVAKSFLNEEIPKDGIICDFTMGGGHDTLYLSDLVPEGKVYAFDIQPLALERTRKRLEEAGGRPNVQLILDSHENFDRYVPGSLMQACSIWATCPLPTMWSPLRQKPPWQQVSKGAGAGQSRRNGCGCRLPRTSRGQAGGRTAAGIRIVAQ